MPTLRMIWLLDNVSGRPTAAPDDGALVKNGGAA
jgi:hypothetical protein